ncbi:MAG: hypothetical protein ACRCYS_04965 [Beijerinckiaceae bacterium]
MTDTRHRAAMRYALAQMQALPDPHPKMTLEQVDALAGVRARAFLHAYCSARDVLDHIDPERGEE